MQTIEGNFTKIVDGLPGAEGPVFSLGGTFYMVVPEVENNGNVAGQIVKVDLKTGKVEVVCEPNFSDHGGIPAGLQVDKNGDLWVADMRHGILYLKPDGTIKQVTKTDSAGDVMQGCNDCIFDYDGNLWVTAPAGKIAPNPYLRSFGEPFGSVFCLTHEGKVIKVDTGFNFSNGIAVQHMEDGRPKRLIVAETPKKTLWAYDIVGPGLVENKRVWGRIPGEHEGGPDGMDFDSEGNLLVANWGSSHLEVFGPEGGDPKYRVHCPFSKPSNMHFKPNSTELYVTEHDSHGLWKFNWKNEGRREYCELLSLG